MPRLVDANEILKSEHQHYDYIADEYYVLVRDIENAPTVDAIEVVRCKDCEYSNGEYKYCVNDIFAKPNGYCSYGKRKEDDDNFISNKKCSECLHAQNITGLRISCNDCGAKRNEVV